MTDLTVVYWRDIPAQVIAGSGRKATRRQLSDRFQEAIDRAAMRTGAHGTDAYLAEWRRGEPCPCNGDVAAEVEAMVAALERDYDDARLDRLVAAGGRQDP